MAAPKPSALETILSLANKRGVSIYIDGDTDSQDALAGHKYTYYKPDKILTIFISNFDKDDQEKLFPLVRKVFEDTGLVLRDTQEEVIESYSNYINENPHQTILEFFEEKIPSDDFNALKMSLFMRNEKERGANIATYKYDIG